MSVLRRQKNEEEIDGLIKSEKDITSENLQKLKNLKHLSNKVLFADSSGVNLVWNRFVWRQL